MMWIRKSESKMEQWKQIFNLNVPTVAGVGGRKSAASNVKMFQLFLNGYLFVTFDIYIIQTIG